MLSWAVCDYWQTAFRPVLQASLFSMLIPSRRPNIPPVCQSLSNFGEIYTETYRRASFFSPSLSLFLLPLPFWLYQNDITHSSPSVTTLFAPASMCWTHLFSLRLHFNSQPGSHYSETHLNPHTVKHDAGLWFRYMNTKGWSDIIALLFHRLQAVNFGTVGRNDRWSLYRALKKARRPVSGDGWVKSFWIWKHSKQHVLATSTHELNTGMFTQAGLRQKTCHNSFSRHPLKWCILY